MVNAMVAGRSDVPEAASVHSQAAILVSVLVPLENHRNYAERSIRAWCSEQTLDRHRYEVIVVASRNFPSADLARIRALLGEHDHVVMANPHDIEQVGAGAAVARGDLLMFTESHVWPGPDLLERCVARMNDRPEWAGLVCGIRRFTVNRLGEVEADMYERDFVSGLSTLRWRNINDSGFCTRRASYRAAGGFDVALGHFAEWELAARYATEGLVVGHCPDILMWHLYAGDIAELRAFTEDFVRGEIAYLGRDPVLRREALIDAPVEWSCRGDRRRDLARHILRLIADEAARALVERRKARVGWRLGFHWLPAIVTGGGAARLAAALRVIASRAGLFVAKRFGGTRALAAVFEGYISALIRRARLQWSDEFLARRRPAETGELWSASSDRGDAAAGFYDCERFDDVPFRWSHPVAVIGLDLVPGKYRIHVNTLSAQLADRSLRPEFYLNGKPITGLNVRGEGNSISFPVDVPSSEKSWLGWMCSMTSAPPDPRLLGLPLVSILATVGDP